jgi:hypothetical protein
VSNQPQFITLIDIECVSTDDLTGDDQLIGRFGNLQATDFTIGQFNSAPGNKVALNVQAIVPVGITTLQIIEQDLRGCLRSRKALIGYSLSIDKPTRVISF